MNYLMFTIHGCTMTAGMSFTFSCLIFIHSDLSVVGLNGFIPFILVKEYLEGATTTGHIVNSSKTLAATNRSTEIMDYLSTHYIRKDVLVVADATYVTPSRSGGNQRSRWKAAHADVPTEELDNGEDLRHRFSAFGRFG